MGFSCSTPGCSGEAKISGQCIKCACEAAKAKRGGVEPEINPACKRCGRFKVDVTGFNDELRLCGTCIEHLGAQKKKEDMAMAKDTRTCPCGAELTPKARKGLCPVCRRKEAQRRFQGKRKAAAGMPPKVEGPLPSDPAIERLLDELRVRLREAVSLGTAVGILARMAGVKTPTLKDLIEEICHE